jgi:hypothetical protein
MWIIFIFPLGCLLAYILHSWMLDYIEKQEEKERNATRGGGASKW